MNVDYTPSSSDKKVKVELLDSGVSYISALENVHHIDLNSSCGDNRLFNDNSGHATALAGLICADSNDCEISGINPNVDLYDVKVLNTNLQAPVSKIVEGIYWGIENNVDIINMSFGTTSNSTILHNAVKEAYNAGILLIAAAGNDSSNGVLYPAAYPEVLSVGSTDSNGNVVEEYANGNQVDIYAPGTQIISTGILDGYTTGCGTSLSTAEITGVASVLMSKDGATADYVKQLMKHTGKVINDNQEKLVDLGFAIENFDAFQEIYSNEPLSPSEIINYSEPESYDVGGIVTGYWTGYGHRWLVREAADSVDEANGNTKLRTNYLNIMKFAADTIDRFKNTIKGTENGYEDCRALHGLGCYGATLKAVWKFANYTNKGDGRMKSYDKAWNDVKDDVAVIEEGMTSMDEERKKDENIEIQILDTNATTKGALFTVRKFLYFTENFGTEKYVKSEYFEGSEDYNDYFETNYGDYYNQAATIRSYTNTNAKKKYLVVGLALHHIGDTYAHRTLVNKYLIQNTIARQNTPQTAADKHFASGQTDLNSFIKYSDIKGDTQDEKNIWIYKSLYHIIKGILPFTKLKFILKGDVKFGTTYEDNLDFCRERLSVSLSASKTFLSAVSSSTDNDPQSNIKKVLQENSNLRVALRFYDINMNRYQ